MEMNGIIWRLQLTCGAEGDLICTELKNACPGILEIERGEFEFENL